MTTAPTAFVKTGGIMSAGGAPTTIVNCRVSAPAWNVSVATPWLPIWMMTFAVCAPAATVTFARTVTIEGLLVATLTGVGASAGFDRSRTPSVCCPPIAVNTRPMNELADGDTTTSTDGANAGGTSANGGPTITVIWCVSPFALSVRTAVPLEPAAIGIDAVRAPAAIDTVPVTVATFGLVLAITTVVSAAAGA